MLRRKKDNTVPHIQEMIANNDENGLREFLSRPVDEVSTQKLVIAATSVSEDTREVTLRLSQAEDKRGAVIEYLLSCASQPAPTKKRRKKKVTSEETKTASVVSEKNPQPHIATSEDVSILKAIADTQYQISQLSEQINQLYQSIIPRMNEMSADASAIRDRVDTEVLPHVRCNTERLNLLSENQWEIARLITTDEEISDADLAKIATAQDITPVDY